jgi:hypothetical protein
MRTLPNIATQIFLESHQLLLAARTPEHAAVALRYSSVASYLTLASDMRRLGRNDLAMTAIAAAQDTLYSKTGLRDNPKFWLQRVVVLGRGARKPRQQRLLLRRKPKLRLIVSR